LRVITRIDDRGNFCFFTNKQVAVLILGSGGNGDDFHVIITRKNKKRGNLLVALEIPVRAVGSGNKKFRGKLLSFI